MILDHLDNAKRYVSTHPLFAKAFEFLGRKDLASLAPGRHEVDGDRLFVVVVKAAGAGREKAALEAHRKYIDIQFLLSGTDEMGWRPLAECKGSKGFDAAKDLEFFTDQAAAWCAVRPGDFAVFFPSDAHAPGGGTGPVHKIVVKVLDR
jgi:YhcH/YjgK/YiaL family protein